MPITRNPAHRRRPGGRTGRSVSAASLAALLALAAGCGADADADETSEPPVVSVHAVDYGYEGLPPQVAAGTKLELVNDSATEVHEAVVFLVAEEDRAVPVAELLERAAADPMALGEFQGVSVALPGEAGVEPDGPVVFAEPGRYVVVCFVPTGAEPAVYREALESGTQPPPGDALPHAAHGMVAEVQVS